MRARRLLGRSGPAGDGASVEAVALPAVPRGGEPRARYEHIHAVSAWLFQRGAEPGDPVDRSGAPSWLRSAVELSDLFLAARATATLAAAVGALAGPASLHAFARSSVRTILQRLDAGLHELAERPSDGLHVGAEYACFAIALLVGAAAELHDLEATRHPRDWIVALCDRFEQLSPAGRASQGFFYLAALLAAESLDESTCARRLDGIASDYLSSRHLDEADAYLRCAYLAQLGAVFGMRRASSRVLCERLGESLRRLAHEGAAVDRYQDPFAIAGYACGGLQMVASPARFVRELQVLADRIPDLDPGGPHAARGLRILGHALVDGLLQVRSESTRALGLDARGANS